VALKQLVAHQHFVGTEFWAHSRLRSVVSLQYPLSSSGLLVEGLFVDLAVEIIASAQSKEVGDSLTI